MTDKTTSEPEKIEILEVEETLSIDNNNNKDAARNTTVSRAKRFLKAISMGLATLLLTVVLLCIFLYGVMAVLVYGPSPTAKKQFIMSVQETSAIGFLANLFCSQEEIDRIKAENTIKDSNDITDTDLIVIDNSSNEHENIPDIQIVNIKGATYKGKLMIVKDPSRVFVGTIDGFVQGSGKVVSQIAARYNAIGGINGGEFVDGSPMWTGMPIGLVMVDGKLVNGSGDASYHVTGITYDNKLVVGNMNHAQAKEKNIRDCVSIRNDIGPFLIINNEAQNVSGIGGGLNPRTAIGQRSDGAMLLLAIDGRQANSLGASFSDLQDIMFQHGAVNASAMDGGTSTQMYYDGSVINVPYSPTGPRSCPTAWLVK